MTKWLDWLQKCPERPHFIQSQVLLFLHAQKAKHTQLPKEKVTVGWIFHSTLLRRPPKLKGHVTEHGGCVPEAV